jgi:hypothetical protein
MTERIGFFEVAPGSRSMGRLLAFLAVVVGGLVAVAGVGLAWYIVARGLEGIGSATAIVASGVGVFAVGEVVKTWAKRVEIEK